MIKGAKKEEVDYATDFLSSLTYTIEKVNQETKHIPSATFSPSSMKCDRQMIYKLLSVPIDDKKPDNIDNVTRPAPEENSNSINPNVRR